MKPSIIPADIEHAAAASGPLSGLARHLLRVQLRRLQYGEIRLIDGDAEERFGARTEDCPLTATIEVRHPRFYSDAVFGGTTGAGASYIQGRWRCSDLTNLTRIFSRNRAVMEEMDRRWTFLSRPLLRIFHWLHGNSEAGSER